MSQHDYILENATGASFRQDLNNALRAIAENNMAATAPTTTYAGMWWLDTSTNPATLRLRNNTNTAWVNCGNLNEMSYLAGVTSDIQAQLNAKAALASPALTGTPTAPTAAAGTNNTQVATTAFVRNSFTQSLANNGWTRLPNGLILQWGRLEINTSLGEGGSTGSGFITFPVAFPTNILHVNSTYAVLSSNSNNDQRVEITTAHEVLGLTGFQLIIRQTQGSSLTTQTNGFMWFALGY